jgi:hypothetical protein
MTSVVILNVVFAVLVVAGIVSHLGRAILAEDPGARSRSHRASRANRVPAATGAGREALAAHT